MYNNFDFISIDRNQLLSIGFSPEEITQFTYVYNNGGKFSTNALQSYGYTYEQAARLHYMYNICSGKVQVESSDQMAKHLKKMFGSQHKISIQDLAISNVNKVPRAAVVHNIKQEPYSIWNSSNYSGKAMLYPVVEATGQSVTIETSRKPKLAYKQSKAIPGMLEILGLRANGKVLVKFSKDYCALCNRFIIVASFKNPEYHLGKYSILCYEGRRIYIYATNMGTKENVKYQMGNQRVYDFGIFPSDIIPKLTNVAKQMYAYLKGVQYTFEKANTIYKVVEQRRTFTDEGDVEY